MTEKSKWIIVPKKPKPNHGVFFYQPGNSSKMCYLIILKIIRQAFRGIRGETCVAFGSRALKNSISINSVKIFIYIFD